MRVRFRAVLPLLISGTFAACESEAVEDYPSGDEVPVVEQTPTGTDTVLDEIVIPPEPGTTPP